MSRRVERWMVLAGPLHENGPEILWCVVSVRHHQSWSTARLFARTDIEIEATVRFPDNEVRPPFRLATLKDVD